MGPTESPDVLLDRMAAIAYPSLWNAMPWWLARLLVLAGAAWCWRAWPDPDARRRALWGVAALTLTVTASGPTRRLAQRRAVRAEIAALMATPGVTVRHAPAVVQGADTLWAVEYRTPTHPETITPDGLGALDQRLARLTAMLSRQMIGGPALELQAR